MNSSIHSERVESQLGHKCCCRSWEYGPRYQPSSAIHEAVVCKEVVVWPYPVCTLPSLCSQDKPFLSSEHGALVCRLGVVVPLS